MERKLGSRLRVAKRGRWARVGSAVVRVAARGIGPAQLLELLHGMSEEDQNTFKRNMGPHGRDDVSFYGG